MSKVWLKCFDPLDRAMLDGAVRLFGEAGIETSPAVHLQPEGGLGIAIFGDGSAGFRDWLELACRQATVLTIALSESGLSVGETWQLINAGAADVIVWRGLPADADDIAAESTASDESAIS